MKKWVKIVLLVALAVIFAAALTIYLTDSLSDADADKEDVVKQVTCLVVMAGVAAIALVFLLYSFNTLHSFTTRSLIDGALCIALAFVLSYIKLWSMPTGGSITLASMLPLCIYANRHGVRDGLIAGVLYGLLQFIQNPSFLSVWQFLLEYPIAFGVIALGGFFKKLPLTILVGCFLRFLCHFFASIVFWGEYLSQDYSSLWIASLVYNGIYMGVDTAICLIISLLPPVTKALDRIMPRPNHKEKEESAA